jgi:uncharacterized protein YhfF
MNRQDSGISGMWRKYLASIGENPENTSLRYRSWYFGGGEKDAEELSRLVLAGEKRATACLKLLFEMEIGIRS